MLRELELELESELVFLADGDAHCVVGLGQLPSFVGGLGAGGLEVVLVEFHYVVVGHHQELELLVDLQDVLARHEQPRQLLLLLQLQPLAE